jgi:hypothetical protein
MVWRHHGKQYIHNNWRDSGHRIRIGLIISVIIAAVLIIKIRIITSLITGALIGIVLNLIVTATQGADIITLLLK